MELRSQSNSQSVRIGVVGSGFVSRGLAFAFGGCDDIEITSVLSRNASSRRRDYPFPDLLTDSVDCLLDRSDVVVLACGDPVYATDVIDQVVQAGLPVVTMDSEFQVTTGSWFAERGYVTEAEGDQPGTLAALRSNAIGMGFHPIVFGNVKGFLNHTPTEEEMRHWAHRQGISLQQVTSFTDGTKLQIEQALVANAFGAGLAQKGMVGLRCDDIHFAGDQLAAIAAQKGKPIADYVRSAHLPAGVFLVCTHDDEQQPYLKYLKLGEGPFYTLMHNFHLCHLEVAKTVRQVVNGAPPLLNNTPAPKVSVATIAKKRLEVGDRITRGIGSFEVRGEAVEIEEHPDHLPIGLASDAILKRPVEPSELLTLDDVDLPDSKALTYWQRIKERSLLRTAFRIPISAVSAAVLPESNFLASVAIDFWDSFVVGQELLTQYGFAVVGA